MADRSPAAAGSSPFRSEQSSPLRHSDSSSPLREVESSPLRLSEPSSPLREDNQSSPLRPDEDDIPPRQQRRYDLLWVEVSPQETCITLASSHQKKLEYLVWKLTPHN